MNETMTLLIWTAFDVIIGGFGIYLLIAGAKMKQSKEPGTLILAEEEIKRCKDTKALADFFCWREAVLGGICVLFGVIRLLNRFWFKGGNIPDAVVMVILLAAVLWFFKSLQTARVMFLSE